MRNSVIGCLAAMLLVGSESSKGAEPDDNAIMEAGIAALEAHNFAAAVEKADIVIARFEATRNPDTAYVCASGGADTLAALVGPMIGVRKNAKASTTVAMPNTICEAYFLKGFALVDLQQRDKALPNLETALAMDPDNQHYANELAEWYKMGREWEKSLALFTAASEMTDFSIATQDDKKEAKRAIDDMRCRSYRGIAFNHVEMRHWAEARDALQKCLALIPGDAKSVGELDYIKANSGQ